MSAIVINNLLTGESMAWFTSNMVKTFVGFHPLGVVLVAMLGIGVADYTGFIKAVKLLNVAGAYWRGDTSRKMLTRIYAVSFPKQGELEEHLRLLEEAKKRDHRKLGQEMELFMFSDFSQRNGAPGVQQQSQ